MWANAGGRRDPREPPGPRELGCPLMSPQLLRGSGDKGAALAHLGRAAQPLVLRVMASALTPFSGDTLAPCSLWASCGHVAPLPELAHNQKVGTLPYLWLLSLFWNFSWTQGSSMSSTSVFRSQFSLHWSGNSSYLDSGVPGTSGRGQVGAVRSSLCLTVEARKHLRLQLCGWMGTCLRLEE